MRKRGRTDQNQKSIVESLRQISGVTVAITSSIGNGFPDLIVSRAVGKSRTAVLIELKDGQKPASRKKLTPDEQKFKSEWEGCYYVCENLDQILKVLGIWQENL